jgi:hypothetical protein
MIALKTTGIQQARSMEVALILEFHQTDDQLNFEANIILQANNSCPIQGTTKLSSTATLELFKKHKQWLNAYCQMQPFEGSLTQPSAKNALGNCREAANLLRQAFHIWLVPIEQTLKNVENQIKANLYAKNPLLIFIRTNHSQLQQLPWQDWNLAFHNFQSVEIILSPPEFSPLALRPRLQGEILTIVDDCDVEQWRESGIAKKLGLQIHGQSEACAVLPQEAGWSIVCWIAEKPLESQALRRGFKAAIAQGLHLIIWNHGLANEDYADLEIDQVIAMEATLPTYVIQEFLSNFIEYYVHSNQDFYWAVREARDSLEPFELELPGVQWQPTISHPHDHRVPSWQEYRQGKSDRRSILLSLEAIEQRRIFVERLKKSYNSSQLIESLRTLADVGIQECSATQVEQRFALKELKNYFEQISIDFEVGKKLLILGEAGSGKSLALLELSCNILDQIQVEYNQPIPVVLNLAVWAQSSSLFEDWIVYEIERKYEIQRDLVRTWTHQEQFSLMLDGLDEVLQSEQEACIIQLNQFSIQHPGIDIVVCCRSSSYERFRATPEFGSVVQLMPLSDGQIDQIVVQQEASALASILNSDRELKQFAQSPLVLSLLLSVFQQCPEFNMPSFETGEDRYHYVFKTYIDQMLERSFLSVQAKLAYRKQLVWLAKSLCGESLTEFWIERLQPSWLKSRHLQCLYRLVFSANFTLIFGVLLASIIWLGLGMIATEVLAIIIALIVAGFCAFMFGLWVWLTHAKDRVIRPVETLNWSSSVVRKALIIGGSIGLIVAIFSKMYGFIFVGPLMVLTSELKGTPLQERTFANQGIWQSLKHSLTFAMIGAGILGGASIILMPLLITSLFGNEAWLKTHTSDWIFWFQFRLFLASCVSGLFFGLNSAGIACIQHFSLRIVLRLKRVVPFNYAKFLDDAIGRSLLRKVGGGYTFIHPLLQAYFSELER